MYIAITKSNFADVNSSNQKMKFMKRLLFS